MKLVTWNVNSINARADFAAQLLDDVQPDVLCVQELKATAEQVPADLFTSRGYHLALHAQPRWNGVLIASKHPIEDVHTGLDGDEGEARLIAATIQGLRLVNLYCPQGQSADSPKFAYKLNFYDSLTRWLDATASPQAPLILTGDLNIAPDPDDIFDPAAFLDVPTYHPKEHAAWARLTAWGLHDAVKPHLKPHTYSFWDYRGQAFRFNKGMRIDHFLLTEPLRDRVQSAAVLRDWRKKRGDLTPSDHAPVELILTP